jgi:hypothetical protein
MPMPDNWSDEETDDPLYADRRNFYKVDSPPRWTKRNTQQRQRRFPSTLAASLMGPARAGAAAMPACRLG